MMQESPPSEVVTKLEAANRQLRVAIRLFFERRDLIAIHTLTAAARGILRSLARPHGVNGIDATIEKLSPKSQKMLRRAFNEAQNFFKHADKDPTGKLNFHYGARQFLLLDAAIICSTLSGHRSPEASAMVAWSAIKFPELYDIADPQFDVFFKLAKGLNPDDYDLVLATIDRLSRTAKLKA
jgi:hypothetical protein